MNPAKFSLRPAADADRDALFALHCLTIRDAVEATWGWDRTFQENHFRERWDPTNRQILMIEGEIAGMVQIDHFPDRHKLALIEIHPAYQNQGIGSSLIQAAIAAAHAQNLPLTLHVLKANYAAKRLYERLGFRRIEERKDRFVMQIDPA